MALRDILVELPVHPEAADPALIVYAADLAQRCGAELTGFLARPDIQPPTHGLATKMLGSMAAEIEARAEADAERLAAAFTEATAARAVKGRLAHLTCVPTMMERSLALTARTHDLTIMAIDPTDGTRRHAVEEVAFGSGRPVLALREPAGGFRLETVAIAWDMSRAAARAAMDALPLMQLATRVLILTVTGEKDLPESPIGKPFAHHLSLHGVAAEQIQIPLDKGGAGQALLARALAEGVDVLAMGAYGHARWREFLLGGATAGALADLRVPILFGH